MTPKKRDANHAQIRSILRQCGYFVADTANLGDGFPDLVVASKTGRVVLIEVKMPEGGVMPKEVEFMLKIVEPYYRVATDAEQVIRTLEGLDK